jgi:hypothetical protein
MGIRVVCPHGHRLHLKAFLAGRRGLCPHCGARFRIPLESSDTPQPLADPPARRRDPVSHVRPVERSQRSTTQSEIPQARAVTAAAGGDSVTADTAPAPQTKANQAAVDLDDDPAALWYVRPPTGGEYGPANADILRDWITEGRVSADCLVWRVGWSDWKSASTILQKPVSPAPSEPPRSPATGVDPAAVPFPADNAWPRPMRPRRSSGYGLVWLVLLGTLGLALAVSVIYLLQTGQIALHLPW